MSDIKKTNVHVFSDFHNLYSLSKTLRFELKPVGKTSELLKQNAVFEKDETVAKNYKEAKKWFDKLHREFIDETLSDAFIPINLLEDYEKAYLTYKNDKTNQKRKNLKKIAERLRKELLLRFENKAVEWRNDYIFKINDEKLKKKISKFKKLEILFKVEVFGLLKQKYPKAIVDGKSIFDSFNKFSTYFTGFHQTRQNFYKYDGTSTAIPTRIVDENLSKFLENKKLYEEKYVDKHENLFIDDEEEIFKLDYFNNCFTQAQIEKYNDIVAGLKSKINKKRQLADKKNNFPFFKTLFKQILAEQTKKDTEQSEFIEITTDNEVFGVLQKFIGENEAQLPKAKKLFKSLIHDQLHKQDEFDINNIYIAGRFINTISNKYFADWNTIRGLFIEKGKKKFADFISLQTLKEKFQSVAVEDKKDFFDEKYKQIYETENDFYKIFLKIWEYEFNTQIQKYNEEYEFVKRMIKNNKKYTNKIGLMRDGKTKGEFQKEIIRLYTEASLSIYQMMKYFSLESGKERNWNPRELDEDAGFYNLFAEYYSNVETWKYFNEFRNYLTKKPYNQNKIKLNFEDGTLLGGWPDSPEGKTQYKSFIFRKNSKYFLGITNYSRILDKSLCPEAYKSNGEVYKKMVYKQLSGKTIYGSLYIGQFGTKYSDDKSKLSKKGMMNRISIILNKKADFFPLLKDIVYDIDSGRYDDLNKIATDISKLNLYSVSFVNVKASYIEKGEYDGSRLLYLFEIYNKDFAEKSSGRKKLHTLYWEEIFSESNRKNPVFKLNGQAEIFFRRATENLEEKHIKTKGNEIVINNKKQNPYHLKRYFKNKILFHCPITLNFGQNGLKKDKEIYKGKADAFSIKVREYLNENTNINIIGIDRGEKHLAYYSVIDRSGNILDTDSLNIINGTDYHKKLDELEKNRDVQRKTWQEIAKIKEMKKGYISQAVKKIIDLMIKHNAIVVFEDLNVGFKRGRFAIEKQIYQNLELALAKKLNYFVQKCKSKNEKGHHTRAYQLTPQIGNFKDIYKQCGFMFYIPASYTSAICPVCGFRKNISTPTETKKKNKEFIEKFDIKYEPNDNRFSFRYKRSEITNESLKGKTKKSDGFRLFDDVELKDGFVFYSNVKRLQYSRKDRQTHLQKPNEDLKRLFNDNDIDIHGDINKQIKAKNLENKNFYVPLIWDLRLILQLRNAIVVKDKDGEIIKSKSHDYIECPSCYFHSESNLKELVNKYKGKGKLNFNGDANGAYNIARKGGLIIEKIRQYKSLFSDLSKMENGDLTVTQKEWDKFVQPCK